MINRITKNYRTVEQEQNLLEDIGSPIEFDAFPEREEADLSKEDPKVLDRKIKKLRKAAKESILKTVFDRQNPRKKLIYFDFILSSNGLVNKGKKGTKGKNTANNEDES